MKRCTKCKQEKSFSEFSKNKNCKDGLHSWCKECERPIGKAHYQRNKQKVKARANAWSKNNPERARAHNKAASAKWRTGRKGDDFTAVQWLALCNQYGNKCLCCGATDKPLTVDHIIPTSEGGANTIDNIQPLCLSCNDKKFKQTTDYRPNR